MGKTATSPAPVDAQTRFFKPGEIVDVLCDHKHQGERVRGWLQGVVVQADEKMAAVQFLDDVYLTDGWMVPDRVLWCRQGSDSIRPATRRRLGRSTSKRG
jgi:hypothetical protein